jgi:hypothetical protein
MPRLPLIALALALGAAGPAAAAEDATPRAQLIPAAPSRDLDDWIAPDEKANPFDRFDPPSYDPYDPSKPVSIAHPPFWTTLAQRAPFQTIGPPKAWETATWDIVSICYRETMPYCVCLANRLPTRMSSPEYTKMRADLASMGNSGMGHHETVPLAVAALQESTFCAKKTGVSH